MKKSLICSVTLVASLSSAQAFSLDFTGVTPDGDFIISATDPGTFVVPGFGNLTFFIPGDQNSNVLAIDDNFDATPAFEFEDGDGILVQFNQQPDLGENITGVLLNFVGGGSGTYSVFSDNAGESLVGRVDWTGGDGGLSGIEFQTSSVPEPSVSLLGALGMLALLRRRR